jgi:hypothetical protein
VPNQKLPVFVAKRQVFVMLFPILDVSPDLIDAGGADRKRTEPALPCERNGRLECFIEPFRRIRFDNIASQPDFTATR